MYDINNVRHQPCTTSRCALVEQSARGCEAFAPVTEALTQHRRAFGERRPLEELWC